MIRKVLPLTRSGRDCILRWELVASHFQGITDLRYFLRSPTWNLLAGSWVAVPMLGDTFTEPHAHGGWRRDITYVITNAVRPPGDHVLNAAGHAGPEPLQSVSTDQRQSQCVNISTASAAAGDYGAVYSLPFQHSPDS
jgi:hypothetical protein